MSNVLAQTHRLVVLKRGQPGAFGQKKKTSSQLSEKGQRATPLHSSLHHKIALFQSTRELPPEQNLDTTHTLLLWVTGGNL